jgi:ectoine hydroxylase-related dioxygenase (phytanoyl-CoA dioxygenase family)
MNGHRHCHVNRPGTRSQSWHQDGTNQRHHQLRTVLAMYYPQEVTPDLGPTVILPGTHFRNAPTDRMATYANFREQVVLTVPAGTVAITHYDIWHAASANRGERTRYMLKFLFSRGSESTGPSWKHDPERAAALLRRFTFERACGCGQSDHYKERGLRFEMWNHLLGKAA